MKWDSKRLVKSIAAGKMKVPERIGQVDGIVWTVN